MATIATKSIATKSTRAAEVQAAHATAAQVAVAMLPALPAPSPLPRICKANLAPRYTKNGLPTNAIVELGHTLPSAARCHKQLLPALQAFFAGPGPHTFGAMAKVAVPGHGSLAQHISYLTGLGAVTLTGKVA